MMFMARHVGDNYDYYNEYYNDDNYEDNDDDDDEDDEVTQVKRGGC